MKRYYARLDQEQRLFELEREPSMAHEWVRGWAFELGAPEQRGMPVSLNPRYIRFHWSEQDQGDAPFPGGGL